MTSGSISGRVVDAGGVPVAGTAIAIIQSPGAHREIAALTAQDGQFYFGGMAPGHYVLSARGAALAATAAVTVVSGLESRIEIGPGVGGHASQPANAPARPRPEVAADSGGSTLVTDLAAYPWRCICSLLITMPNASQRTGTGWLAGPRLVLTAGQCVYRAGEGGWASAIEVIPGRNGEQHAFGAAISREFRSVRGWTDDADPGFDYGAILLPEDSRFGDRLGWLAYASRSDEHLRSVTLNLSGYPAVGGARLLHGSQYWHSGPARSVTERQIGYQLDAGDGQIGAPVWELAADGRRYAVGIHARHAAGVNTATRITHEVVDNVVRWAGQAP